jgi:hypothetical protein
MTEVELRILPDASALAEDNGEDWGRWNFTSLPRAGDHIDLERNDGTVLLTVQRVIHFAVRQPLPRSEMPYRQRKEPSICVLAVQQA